GRVSRNADRMLAATLAVLAPHRPGAAASPALHSAWRARENAVWYYDRLLEAVREDVARGAWLSTARRLLIFARYVPQHPQYARRGLLAPLRLAGRVLRRPTAARASGARELADLGDDGGAADAVALEQLLRRAA